MTKSTAIAWAVFSVVSNLLVTPPASAGDAARADLATTCRTLAAEIHAFEQQLGTEFREGNFDGLMAHTEITGADRQKLETWLRELERLRKDDTLENVSVDLPVLAALPDKALVRYGCFDVRLASGARHRYDWPPVLLERRPTGWTFVEAALVPVPPVAMGKVQHATFSVCPVPDSSSLTATATFAVANAGDQPLTQLPVYLRHPLRLEEATLNGRPFEAEVSYGTLGGSPVAALLVPLHPALPPNGTLELSVRYSASYARHDLGRKPVGFTADRGFVLWETGWYPSFSQDWVTLPYDMSITVPDGFLALTSGELTGQRTEGSTRTFSYRTATAESPYFIWGRYEEAVRETGGVKLSVWTPTGGSIDPQPMLKVVSEVFDALSPLLPPPDFAQQRIIAVTRFGGYGATGNLLIEDGYFAPDRIGKLETLELIAHEFSHSWVNSLSQPTGKPTLFLGEGLATYLGAKTVERARSAADGAQVWRGNQGTFQGIARRAVAPLELTEELQRADNPMFRGVAYNKGAYFFRELETLVGEQRLFETLRQAILAHRGGSFTLDDLTQELDRRADRDLSPFWEAYIRGAGAPDYVVAAAGAEGDLNHVRVRNLGALSSTPVDVVAYDGQMRELARRRVSVESKDGVPVEFGAGDGLAHVVVDPERRVLQAECRNDAYPDHVLPPDDRAAVDALITRIFEILRQGDVAAFEQTLTGRRELLSAADREKLVSSMKRAGAASTTRVGDPHLFRTGEGRAEALVPVKLETPANARDAAAEFEFVREDDGWKVVTLRLR